MFKRVIIPIIAILSVAVYFWQSGEDTIEVEVAEVTIGAVEHTVANTRSGTIDACKRSRLAPAAGGQISALYVDEGDQVKTGDLLIELWNKNHRAAVKKAEAALQAHRLNQHSLCVSAASDDRDAQRLSKLAQQDLAAEDIVDRAISRASSSEAICLAAKSQEKEFQAQLELQQALLEQTFIRAPFSGTIAKVTGEVGEFATPSPPGVPTPPVIDLLTSECVYLTAPIDEVDAGLLQQGQTARVTLDAFRGSEFAGTLRRISPYVQDHAKQARTVDIQVEFGTKERNFLVGYSADVEIILQAKDDAIRIPTESILQDDKVWIINQEDRVEEVTIKKGIGNWRYTEVIEGLKPGDKVVTSLGLAGLEPGVAVTVAND